MSSLVELKEEDFETLVLGSELPALVDFAAEWCPPCKILGPIVEEIAKEYEGRAVVAHIDVDKAQNLARQYQVLSIPTVVFFKNGEAVESSIGAVPKQKLTEILDRLI
ncbi:thioredoxin [bacterium]|nr:thioredoxin [bacterium]